MTTLAVELTGLDQLDASVVAVVQAIQSPATAEAGARLVAAAARPLVPVDSGTLAQSERIAGTATGAALVYAQRYAPIVSARDPWLGDAVSAAIPQLVEVYGTAAVEAWESKTTT